MTRSHESLIGSIDAEETRTAVSRRTFLRGAATAVVGAGGVTALSGPAAAKSDSENAEAPDGYPRVSTRDHFDDNGSLVGGNTDQNYDVEGDLGSGELLLFVHGWNNDDANDDDVNSAYECQLALEQNGYGGNVAAYSWDSDKGDSWDLGWSTAKDIAEKNGPKLANFVTDRSGPVRLVGHSLGARVAIFALQSLEDDFGAADAVESVTLVGGAIARDAPSLDAGWFDSEYGDHIEYATRQFDNFYADDDEVLEYVFETREFEDAVGEKGIDGPAPDNYTDVDVTAGIDAHGDYYKRDVGCVPQIVGQF
ncbi:alpha/beta fold hydrolase [Halorientalis salina]|uniref:alpha/beta fold hydrolase n=1 Tax=Halorientalis salina TaxID=2932266 RepID=UPI0010AD67A7|nr:alpha/beta fold hydrolase [Halorientalis salina]